MSRVVKFKKLHPDAKPPAYQTDGAVGADLTAVEDVDILPGKFRPVKTGLSVELERGTEMQIRPRSGLAFKHGVTVLNTPGTIDSDYRGELMVILINHGEHTFRVNKGDRIAQAVLNKIVLANYQERKSLQSTERDAGGFGSTGRN